MKILYVLEFLPPYVKREIEFMAASGAEIQVLLPVVRDRNGTAGLWNKITTDPKGGKITVKRCLPLHLLNAGAASILPKFIGSLTNLPFLLSSLGDGELKYALAALHAVKQTSRSFIPDLIHAHFALDAAQIARKMSEILNVPYTVTTHATDIFVPRNLDRLKKVLQTAAHVLTISAYNRDYLIDSGIYPQGATVSRLGVDVSELPKRQGSNLCNGLCIASGLVEKKGIEILLKSLDMLKDDFPDLKVTIVGTDPSGELLENYRSLTTELPVEFTGALTSELTLDLLSRAGFFVLPCVVASNGDRDGIPVALMEAMGMGVPSISTRVSGIPELITDGESGYLADPGSSESLAKQIRKLLSYPEKAREIAQAGRDQLISRHSPGKQAETLSTVFQAVVKSNRKG